METKYVKVPFDVELAKKITNGEVEGKIVTRDGRNARVACWDLKAINKSYSILALIDNGNEEVTWTYSNNGRSNTELESKHDLKLEIPEYMTFKDGDILICECGTPFIYKDTKDRHGNFSAFCGIDLQGTIFFDMKGWTYSIKGYANEEQKKIIIDALKASKETKAKEYLKRFFGIEQKQEYEFKLFDRVLVRDDEEDDWKIAEYSHKTEFNQYYVVGGLYWLRCIPYNEKTSHLLGTTEDYKED